jgi:hypothetical protein
MIMLKKPKTKRVVTLRQARNVVSGGVLVDVWTRWSEVEVDSLPVPAW